MGWFNKVTKTIRERAKRSPAPKPRDRPRPKPEPLQDENDGIPQHKTGTVCKDAGDYLFFCYLDGTADPEPTDEERVIPLDAGDRFPPVNSSDKACYWIKSPQ